MSATYVTNVSKCYPSAATGTVLTPNSTTNTFSAWFQIHASTPAVWQVWSLAFQTDWPNGPTERGHVWFQLGTGAAASETVVANFDGFFGSSINCNEQVLRLTVPRTIPAGSRLSVRLSKAGTSTADCRVSVGYYEGTLAGSSGTVGGTIPVLAAADTRFSASVSPDTAEWEFGDWTELTASTAAEFQLAHVIVLPDWFQVTLARAYEIQIGVGTLGNEVTVASVRGYKESNDFSLSFVIGGMLRHNVWPMRTIPSGSRLCARIRKTATGAPSWVVITDLYSGTLTPAVSTGTITYSPDDAAFTELPASGNWGNTDWVEFITATDEAMSIVSFFGGIATFTGGSQGSEVDIGIGADGEETVLTTFRLFPVVNSLNTMFYQTYLPVGSADIPAGTRVSVRWRSGNTTPLVLYGAFAYIETPSFTNRGYPQKVYPSSTNNVIESGGGGAWTNSDWKEITAATATDIAVTGFTPGENTEVDQEFDIGVGALGSETVAGTFRVPKDAQAPNQSQWYPFGYPFYVAQGSRISFRARCSATPGLDVCCALTYIELNASQAIVTPDFDTEDVAIVVDRIAPTLNKENQRVFYPRLELLMAVGVGLTTGQGSDPQVQMRLSNDGGQTWSNFRNCSFGALGEYNQRVYWDRCGQARNRVFWVRVSDPVFLSFYDAFLHGVEAGTN